MKLDMRSNISSLNGNKTKIKEVLKTNKILLDLLLLHLCFFSQFLNTALQRVAYEQLAKKEKSWVWCIDGDT